MLKIHVGCGKRDFGPAWYQIDGEDLGHIQDNDIYLRKFRNGSIEIIYASHFIEYFDLHEVTRLLKKWYDKLMDGGTIRIAVPDFEAMARLYISDPQTFPLKSFLGPLYGRMDLNDTMVYHKYCFDFRTLKELLTEIGFKDIYRYDWRQTEHAHIDDQSQAYLPKLDKENGNLISLNVEATK